MAKITHTSADVFWHLPWKLYEKAYHIAEGLVKHGNG
jgi:hypothetical protein